MGARAGARVQGMARVGCWLAAFQSARPRGLWLCGEDLVQQQAAACRALARLYDACVALVWVCTCASGRFTGHQNGGIWCLHAASVPALSVGLHVRRALWGPSTWHQVGSHRVGVVPAGNIRAGAVRLIFNKVVAALLGLPSDPATAAEGLKVLQVRRCVALGTCACVETTRCAWLGCCVCVCMPQVCPQYGLPATALHRFLTFCTYPTIRKCAPEGGTACRCPYKAALAQRLQHLSPPHHGVPCLQVRSPPRNCSTSLN